MGWKEDLLPAKFAGSEFFYSSVKISGGIRTAVHELPKSNAGFVEQFGFFLRKHRVDGYFLDDNHHREALEFIKVLEAGSDILEMPLYGQAKVVCNSYDLTETSEKGRYSKIEMKFTLESSGEIGGVSANRSGLISQAVGAVVSAISAVARGRI